MTQNKSVEAKVEEHYWPILDCLGLRHYDKNEDLNQNIAEALRKYPSKDGDNGGNYPDSQIMLDDHHGRYIPVMIEAKGTAGKMAKTDADGEIVMEKKDGTQDTNATKYFAVNGAVHYTYAILQYTDFKEAIAIGINGSELDDMGCVRDFELEAYYVSKKNQNIPKKIPGFAADSVLLASDNADRLFGILDTLNLTDKELEDLKNKEEATLEEKIKHIHQEIYEDDRIETALGTNEKLYLFCGLVMAGLPVEGVKPLEADDLASNDDPESNDGEVILQHIRSFLRKKQCSSEQVSMIMNLIEPVFRKEDIWKPHNGENVIKDLFLQIKEEIIPILETDLHLDFTGKILNSLSEWVNVENDQDHDVVLTPRYITSFMAKLAHTDRNSFVWDWAMGSGSFLVSAMDIMIKDAEEHITDKKELEQKIQDIETEQIFGVEILGNIYILAVLNMILMGGGFSNMINGDSHKLTDEQNAFPATVFLLNPPYSAPGKGFNFVEEALSLMNEGYACILIQENAGSGQGLPYTKNILKHNTLLASIHMPAKLFSSANVAAQTAIYLFKVGRPHEEDDLVKFIDMSDDGYSRQSRKKSTQAVNLRDTDDASGRYAEVEAHILGKKPKTDYYTKENGLYIEDTISLDGNDWTLAQHKQVDSIPTEEDFKKAVADYLSWKIGTILKEEDTV